MTEHSESSQPDLDQVLESFLESHRRGEDPSIEDYADAHPGLADEIREVFPALMMMEDLGNASSPTGNTAAAATFPTAAPKQLGDYRILREVGRGGMGVVYEAEQVSLGRHVALKVLPFHGLMDAKYLERFRREAQAAASLHHSNIVPVFGVGEHEGVHYYAMQFIQGQPLDEVIAELRRIRSSGDGSSTTLRLPGYRYR